MVFSLLYWTSYLSVSYMFPIKSAKNPKIYSICLDKMFLLDHFSECVTPSLCTSLNDKKDIYSIYIKKNKIWHWARISSFGSSGISRGLNQLFRRIIFSIHVHGKWFLKTCISFLWFEVSIVIGYFFVSFPHKIMENIFVLTKCDVLFNTKH